MVGLRDARLVITCINFTHQAKGQVLKVTVATKIPDIMTPIKVGRYSQKQIFSVDNSGYFGSGCNVFI
jgi:hypothetical protein